MNRLSTIEYYNTNADSYFDQTVNIDIHSIRNRFLEFIPQNGYILDFGCGSGRDSKYFIDNGYRVKSIDGSEKLALLASKFIGKDVQNMNFEDLDDIEGYDGIWACASILHVKRNELYDILVKMNKALVIGGYMYISFKNGDNEEIIDGRYYNNMTKNSFLTLIESITSLELVDYYKSPFLKNGSETKYWNNFILCKTK